MTERISQQKLINGLSDVLRSVEAGEEFVITVGGRPVAELRPVTGRRFVPRAEVQAILRTPTDPTFLDDIRALRDLLDDGPRDPWEQ